MKASQDPLNKKEHKQRYHINDFMCPTLVLVDYLLAWRISQHNTEYIGYNDILHISIWNTTRVNIVWIMISHSQ